MHTGLGDLVNKDSGKKAFGTSALSAFADTKSRAAFSNSCTFFLLEPLTTAIACLVALDILCKSQLQLSFVFPNTCLGKPSKFLFHNLSLLLPSLYCLSALKLVDDFPV